MARPRGQRQGRRVTIYLTPERLDKLGWEDPAGKIYDMVDDLEIGDGTEEATEEAGPQQVELRRHDPV